MTESVIAVVSTVIGTIVGWILGNIKFGRLFLSVSNEKTEPHYTDPHSLSVPGKWDYELYNVKISFVINLYNSSQIVRAIRDCQLAFLDNCKKEIACLPVMDEATRLFSAGGYRWDDVDVVNVGAYESMNLSAVLFVSDIETVYNTHEIRFKYKDERFRQRTIEFKDVDLTAIPRFCKEDFCDE